MHRRGPWRDAGGAPDLLACTDLLLGRPCPDSDKTKRGKETACLTLTQSFPSSRIGSVSTRRCLPDRCGAALLLCALYLRGVIWMWSQGRRWSVARTIAFVLGCALMFMVATFGVNRYASVSLTALMFQQITLMTVVPPLIIVGSPGRLLLHSTPHHGIGRIVLQAAHGGLRSRWARALLHPVTPIVIALALFPALYLTDFISIAMMTPVGADLILAVFLVGGLVAGCRYGPWTRFPEHRLIRHD
ncbi:cytochrome c oxidase assembly protein [Arthrobacter crystallopoietes]|uniref:cytochrome c oxidase assembly protein n=1 Tax=Crystallibacter crystallopoietes TaxID=37928 RepID=UPI0009F4D787|nr:cytochrome c oxidase assembly protein [Arthrobacter crystallopoietes]